MASVDTALRDAPTVNLPGLGRALISAGKLTQQAAGLVRKARSAKTDFITEVTGAERSLPATSHTVASIFLRRFLISMPSTRPGFRAIFWM